MSLIRVVFGLVFFFLVSFFLGEELREEVRFYRAVRRVVEGIFRSVKGILFVFLILGSDRVGRFRWIGVFFWRLVFWGLVR